MLRAADRSQYEVYCNRCGVSFPIGTRRCIHCGGPTARQRQGGARPEPRLEFRDDGPFGAEDELEIEEEGIARRRGVFSPIALVWLALAVAMTVYRACTGGA